jgi:acetyl esterase/lipase
MVTAIKIILITVASISLLLCRFALMRLRQPTSPVMWLIKVLTSALSPVLFIVSLLTALLAVAAGSSVAMVIGFLSATLYLIHIIMVLRKPPFSGNLDKGWNELKMKIPKDSQRYFLLKPYVFLLPNAPEPFFHQNIPFYTIKDTDRQLLCDIWQPSKDIPKSGLAFIYLHGSAWTHLDKDYGTRTFFRHLTAQGHVIMDVAYRLFPETDFMGMLHDTKHAIAWMKANAEKYNVDPRRIVIGGGSAGAHLALLAAYTTNNKQLIPADLDHVDLSMRAVVSLYGQSDLAATYYYTCQHLTSQPVLGKKKKATGQHKPSLMEKRMGNDFYRLGFNKDVEPGQLVPILGGTPEEKSDAYALYSPVTHVHGDCPETFFLHGSQDILAPLDAIHHLQKQLTDAGVASSLHIVPQADHAFDLILPRISPAAHYAYYDVERFLAHCAHH